MLPRDKTNEDENRNKEEEIKDLSKSPFKESKESRDEPQDYSLKKSIKIVGNISSLMLSLLLSIQFCCC